MSTSEETINEAASVITDMVSDHVHWTDLTPLGIARQLADAGLLRPEMDEEWGVEYPAGVRSVSEDRADAEEDVQWIVDGHLVRRYVSATEWEGVPDD